MNFGIFENVRGSFLCGALRVVYIWWAEPIDFMTLWFLDKSKEWILRLGLLGMWRK